MELQIANIRLSNNIIPNNCLLDQCCCLH